jgi:hypothetical protein
MFVGAAAHHCRPRTDFQQSANPKQPTNDRKKKDQNPKSIEIMKTRKREQGGKQES